MKTIQAIKPGPKPKREDGNDDQRRRVNPETKPKHPTLKPHVHKPNDQVLFNGFKVLNLGRL